MLLLGAGASVEAGIPDAGGMTAKIAELFRDRVEGRYAHAINFIIGGLLFQKGVRNEYPIDSRINVEDLFNAVRLLRDRHQLEAAPFVGSWHALIEELDTEPPLPPDVDGLYRSIADLVVSMMSEASRTDTRWISTPSWASFDFRHAFETALSRTPRGGRGQLFEEIGEMMTRMLASIVWISGAERVSYLRPILSLTKEQRGLTVASLNYDNGIELLAESGSVLCSTGIEEWSLSGEFDVAPNDILLLKLHGSIDWEYHTEEPSNERPIPLDRIRRVSAERVQKGGFRPAVVFGQRNKLTADGPFLDLLRAFRRELGKVSTVTAVGYSFRDEHINVYLWQWLNQSADRRLRVIDPGLKNGLPIPSILHQLGNRVQLLPVPASEGLTTLYGTFPPSGTPAREAPAPA